MKKRLLIICLIFTSSIGFAQNVEKKLKEMGYTLPVVQPPIAAYVNAVRTGNLIFLSGKGPGSVPEKYAAGKVGIDLTIEEGQVAARYTALNQLAALKAEIGNLDKVKRIVKVLGMVNCPADFTQQPKVINGFSEFMIEVFGEKGRHARSAVGVGSLPGNIPVEIELIVEVEE